jgi:hypothetical protein
MEKKSFSENLKLVLRMKKVVQGSSGYLVDYKNLKNNIKVATSY